MSCIFLGGKLTTNPGDCTVLVTDQIRRTAKFLCTMGKGIPIVSRLWLVNSKDAKTFLGKKSYDFSLQLFFGYQLYSFVVLTIQRKHKLEKKTAAK
jgi:hypothetical protein